MGQNNSLLTQEEYLRKITKSTHLCNKVSKEYGIEYVAPMNPTLPKLPNMIRVVCLSDTHGKEGKMVHPVPPGDILIHAGDFTDFGGPHQIIHFNQFLKDLPHKHKLVIAGNHEVSLDKREFPYKIKYKNKLESPYDPSVTLKLLSDCIYLQDSGINLYGYNFWGTPWQDSYSEWAFYYKECKIKPKFKEIPNNTDILITHTAPMGIGDRCMDVKMFDPLGYSEGSIDLLEELGRIKPQYHVFGHTHDQPGIYLSNKLKETRFINATICDKYYSPTNPPIIFDLPIKADY